MRAAVVLVFVAISSVVALDTEAAVEEWVARYDGGSFERATAVAVDVQGNVYVTGNGSYKWQTIKYDSDGNEQWVATYSYSDESSDAPLSIAVDVEGNVYVAGTSGWPLSLATTIKYGRGGNEEWVATYAGASANAITVDGQGNVYMTGSASERYEDYVTIKYDPEGDQQWVVTYDGPAGGPDSAEDIILDASGNVYVTGTSGGSPSQRQDYATVKYDTSGVQQWAAIYDRSGDYAESLPDRPNYSDAPALAVDGQGSVFVAGVIWLNSHDWVIVKYDDEGTEEWTATHNGSGNVSDWAEDIGVDGEGNVIVTGDSYSSGGANADCATIKYDTDGNELWVTKYNGSSDSYDHGYELAVNGQGSVYVTGICNTGGSRSHHDYLTIKYDPDGDEEWVATYNGPGDGYDAAYAIALDSEGGLVVTGTSLGDSGSSDYATIKYSPESPELSAGTQVAVDGVARAGEQEIFILLDLAAPADVTVRIYDLSGHLVAVPVDSEFLSEEPMTRSWDLTNEQGERIASGTYFCVVEIGNETTEHRIAVVRG